MDTKAEANCGLEAERNSGTESVGRDVLSSGDVSMISLGPANQSVEVVGEVFAEGEVAVEAVDNSRNLSAAQDNVEERSVPWSDIVVGYVR